MMGRVLVVYSVALLLLGALTDDARAGSGTPFGGYREVLAAYVNDSGEVDYDALKADSGRLESFISSLAIVTGEEYGGCTEDERVALWLNAYNALTLKAIIDHYPIRASDLKAPRFPENSIRQIPGVWNRLTFTVMGREVTLDQIEHQILRKEFSVPGIHMALVCAAASCPILRAEPYEGDRLKEQLRDQTVRFLGSSKNFRIDRENGRVFLSAIFRWYGEDFKEIYTPADSFDRHRPAERAVLNFISLHLEDPDSGYLRDASYRVKYIDYNWTLNEQKRR